MDTDDESFVKLTRELQFIENIQYGGYGSRNSRRELLGTTQEKYSPITSSSRGNVIQIERSSVRVGSGRDQYDEYDFTPYGELIGKSIWESGREHKISGHRRDKRGKDKKQSSSKRTSSDEHRRTHRQSSQSPLNRYSSDKYRSSYRRSRRSSSNRIDKRTSGYSPNSYRRSSSSYSKEDTPGRYFGNSGKRYHRRSESFVDDARCSDESDDLTRWNRRSRSRRKRHGNSHKKRRSRSTRKRESTRTRSQRTSTSTEDERNLYEGNSDEKRHTSSVMKGRSTLSNASDQVQEAANYSYSTSHLYDRGTDSDSNMEISPPHPNFISGPWFANNSNDLAISDQRINIDRSSKPSTFVESTLINNESDRSSTNELHPIDNEDINVNGTSTSDHLIDEEILNKILAKKRETVSSMEPVNRPSQRYTGDLPIIQKTIAKNDSSHDSNFFWQMPTLQPNRFEPERQTYHHRLTVSSVKYNDHNNVPAPKTMDRNFDVPKVVKQSTLAPSTVLNSNGNYEIEDDATNDPSTYAIDQRIDDITSLVPVQNRSMEENVITTLKQLLNSSQFATTLVDLMKQMVHQTTQARSVSPTENRPNTSNEQRSKERASVPQELTVRKSARSTTPTFKNIDPELHSLKMIPICPICKKPCVSLLSHCINKHPDCEAIPSRLAPTMAECLRNRKRVECEVFRPKITLEFRQLCLFCNSFRCYSKGNWIYHISVHTGYFHSKCNHCSMLRVMKPSKGKCYEVNDFDRIPQPQFQGTDFVAYICDLCNFVRFHKHEMEKHLRCEHQDDPNKFQQRTFLTFPKPGSNRKRLTRLGNRRGAELVPSDEESDFKGFDSDDLLTFA